MKLETFINLVTSGVVLAAIYALMSVGLTMIYGITRVFNYGQSAFYTTTGYIAYVLFGAFGKSATAYIFVAITSVSIISLMGFFYEKAIISPLRKRSGSGDPLLTVLVVTIGFALALQNILLVIFGSQNYSLPNSARGAIEYGMFYISMHDLITIFVSGGIMAALGAFLKYTRAGMAMRAVSQDPVGSRIVGMNHDFIFALSFAIAAGLAGLSCIFLAPRTLLYPNVGWQTFIKSMVIIVFGGLGSIKGTLVASLILAFVEIFASFYFGGTWALPFFLGIMVLMFVFKPKGLFGKWG
ncbi:MAG: branched-chain amino acid ABC transporter permease [Oscillospiraceae bacterium]|nr:branched-chain amino acid ABC transporter permease [Oscillospiraceae bacterium]